MTSHATERLRQEVETLRIRLEEAEETLRAIRAGEVEALVIESHEGPRVFALEGVNHSYRVLVEQMSEGAASINEAGMILYANNRLAAMLERPLERVMGSSLFEHIPPSHAPTVRALMQVDAQAEWRGEVPLLAAQGAEVPAHFSFSAAEQAGVRVFSLVITDLRSQKQFQEIVASERLARAVIEQATDAVVVCDAQGRIIRASSPAINLCASNPVLQLFDETFHVTLSPFDGHFGELQPFRDLGVAEASLRGGVARVATAVLRRAGGGFADVLISASPLRGSAGQVVGCVISMIDVSETKRTEQALAVLTRLYAVLSQVNEAIVRTRDEQSLYEDTCRIVADQGEYCLVWLGFAKHNAVVPSASAGPNAHYLDQIAVQVNGEFGMGPTGTCIRENRPVINDDFESNAQTAPWRDVALACGIRSSAGFPLRRRGVPVGALTLYSTRAGTFDAQHMKLLAALCDDISYAMDALDQDRRRTEAEQALKKSESSLREANARKSAFIATLSHELRNPLAPLQNSVYILERAHPEGDQAKRAKAIMSRQVSQLTRLIDDLLDVTRISSGKLRLQRMRFDLAQTIHRVAEDHRAAFVKAGIQFNTKTSVDSLWLQGDEQRIAQVVGNLLLNALKFTTPLGQVDLELTEDAPHSIAVIRVRDTGVGISADMLPQLFEAFSQSDESLDRSKGGLGLGLAIVKGLVQMHQGTVEARSAGRGLGAEFVVSLPSDQTPHVGKASRAPSVRPAARRILVIEDNEDTAATLKEVLEFNAQSVQVAHDGFEGLEKARVFNPDIVLCDIGLPGMNGYEVAEAFRSDEALRNMWLVAVTGYAQPEDLRRASAAGFDRHVRKPISLEEIDDLLSNMQPRCIGN